MSKADKGADQKAQTNTTLEAENQALKKDLAHLSDVCENMKSEIETYKAELNNLREQNEEQRTNAERLAKEYSDLMLSKVQLEEQIVHLKKDASKENDALLSDKDLAKIAKDVFKTHEAAPVLFVTRDGTPFFDEEPAKQHALAEELGEVLEFSNPRA